MVPIDTVTDWLADHGYRDQYPRRDATHPDVLFYVYVKEGRSRLGVRSVRGMVKQAYFDRLRQVVMQEEQDEQENR